MPQLVKKATHREAKAQQVRDASPPRKARVIFRSHMPYLESSCLARLKNTKYQEREDKNQKSNPHSVNKQIKIQGNRANFKFIPTS